jgi:hypothetical protein
MCNVSIYNEKFQNMTPNSTASHGLTPNSSTFQELTPGTRIASKLGTLLIFSSSSSSFHRLASFFFLLRFWCQGHGGYRPSQGQHCGGGSSGGQGSAARWCSGRLLRGHPHVLPAVSSAAAGAAPSYGRSSRGRDLGWTGFGSATTEARAVSAAAATVVLPAVSVAAVGAAPSHGTSSGRRDLRGRRLAARRKDLGLSPPTALVVLLASAGAAPFHNRNWASREVLEEEEGYFGPFTRA